MPRCVQLPRDKFLVQHRSGGDSWVVEISADSPDDAARHVAGYAGTGAVPGIVARLPEPLDLLRRLRNFSG